MTNKQLYQQVFLKMLNFYNPMVNRGDFEADVETMYNICKNKCEQIEADETAKSYSNNYDDFITDDDKEDIACLIEYIKEFGPVNRSYVKNIIGHRFSVTEKKLEKFINKGFFIVNENKKIDILNS